MYTRREALQLWKQKLGDEATYRNLIDVFETAGYKNYADMVRSIIGKCMQLFVYMYYLLGVCD